MWVSMTLTAVLGAARVSVRVAGSRESLAAVVRVVAQEEAVLALPRGEGAKWSHPRARNGRSAG